MSDGINPYASPGALLPFVSEEGVHAFAAEDEVARRKAAIGLRLLGWCLSIKFLCSIIWDVLFFNRRRALQFMLGPLGLVFARALLVLLALGVVVLSFISLFYFLPIARRLGLKRLLIASMVCQIAAPSAVATIRMLNIIGPFWLRRNIGFWRDNLFEVIILSISATLFFVFLKGIARFIAAVECERQIKFVILAGPMLFWPSTGFALVALVGGGGDFRSSLAVYVIEGLMVILFVRFVLTMRKALLLEPTVIQG